MAMRRFSVPTSAVLAIALLSGCAPQAIACVAVPTTIPSNRLLTTDDAHLTVPVNAIVWVALVEADKYTAHPGFPWLKPTTSNRAVLAPVTQCKQTLVTSLPERISAFKALRPGRATVTARLAPGWPGSIRPRLRLALSIVTVR
jgi:hypothetical protein